MSVGIYLRKYLDACPAIVKDRPETTYVLNGRFGIVIACTAAETKCRKQFIEFWRKLWMIHYDNKNEGFTTLRITKKHN
jgi:hypothetical protein